MISYLENVDPEAAETARERYSQLGSFRPQVERYVHAVHSGLVKSQAAKLEQQLKDLADKEQQYSSLLRYVCHCVSLEPAPDLRGVELQSFLMALTHLCTSLHLSA